MIKYALTCLVVVFFSLVGIIDGQWFDQYGPGGGGFGHNGGGFGHHRGGNRWDGNRWGYIQRHRGNGGPGYGGHSRGWGNWNT